MKMRKIIMCVPGNNQHQSLEMNIQQAHVVEQHDPLECPTKDGLGKSVADPAKIKYTMSKANHEKI